MKFTDADYESITHAVAEAERKSAAELVVVIRPRSGDYRDVDYLFGAFVAWVVLLVILFSPWEIEALSIPLELLIVFVLGAFVCSITPLRRWLSARRRRERQVRLSAEAAFFEEGVMNTRARTGVLIYVSDLERRVEVIADTGVEACVSPEDWSAFLIDIKKVEKERTPTPALLESINKLGDVLGRCLPATQDNPDEIANRPRRRDDRFTQRREPLMEEGRDASRTM